MASDLFYLPFLPILSTRGLPSGAAKAYFYLSGTTTLAPIYADAGMTTPLANPVLADNFGRLPDIYLNDSTTYRFYVVDAQGNELYNVDPYLPAHPFQGPPGGNIMATGTMIGLAQMTIPAGTDVIRTTGFYADNDGGDGFYYLAPAGTQGGVGSTADNKVAIPMPTAGVHNARAWGLRPDATTQGGSAGCTDNLPLLQRLLQYGITSSAGVYRNGPVVRFPGAVGYYYFSGTIVLHQTVIFEGDGHGSQDTPTAQASKLTWPGQTVGIQIERYDTNGNVGPTSPTSYGADGTIIRGLALIGPGFTGTAGAYPADVVASVGAVPTYHAIWAKARFRLEDCVIAYWTGNGVHISASTGNTGATRGNANEFFLGYSTVQSVGGSGFWIQGTDANAGTTIGLGTSACGLGGLADVSFLGNNHYGYHNDGCGTLGMGLCVYGNEVYQLVNAITPGIGATTQPGTNSAVWLDAGYAPTFYPGKGANTGTGVLGSITQSGKTEGINQYFLRMTATSATAFNVTDNVTGALLGTGTVGTPATFYGLTFTITGAPAVGDYFTLGTGAQSWSPNINWSCSAAAFSSNPNARSIFSGCYFEGNSPLAHVLAPSMIVQSQGQPTTASSYMFNASGVGGFLASFNGVGAFKNLTSGDLRGASAWAFLDNAEVNWAASATGIWRLGLTAITNSQGAVGSNLYFSWQNGANTGPLISQNYIRSGMTTVEPTGTMWTAPGLLVGAAPRRITTGTAPPTTGSSLTGDMQFNSAPAAGGVPGWVCTTSGVNGSTSVWKAMAALAA